jgi:hypothetical protein
VFENRVLRKIVGPKKDSVTRDWRKLLIEELHELYRSPNIIQLIKSSKSEMIGPCGTLGGEGRWCGVLVVRPEGKRPRGILGIGGRRMLKWILNRLFGNGLDWCGSG